MYTAAKKIKELREQGWKVRVLVTRPTQFIGMATPMLMSRRDDETVGAGFLPMGGSTRIELQTPRGDAFTGISFCHPEKDNFNRKIGLEIAFGRAWKAYETF